MIYTVTLNPALDYTIQVNDFHIGHTNRTKEEHLFAGGKGINVSCLLKELGFDSCALGFTADFTGLHLARMLKQQGIVTDFVHVSEGMTRINVKIKSAPETEINGKGPIIHQDEFQQLLNQVASLQENDWLILSGSIPSCLPEDTYEQVIQSAPSSIQLVIDAEKNLLLNTLKYRPFLIKPNRHELQQMFNVEVLTNEQIVHCAHQLQKQGARNVLVSMDKDGSILVTEDYQIYHMSTAEGTLINSVGAGDSMIGGFIAGWMKTKDYQKALLLATACGGATAFSDGLAKRELILSLLNQLSLKTSISAGGLIE